MAQTYNQILKANGLSRLSEKGSNAWQVRTPIDGSVIASLFPHKNKDVAVMTARAQKAFESWRRVPAPVRGELIRLFGETLRESKETLAQLVTLESGKILSEGRGEVQEMIDICDFAVGLSRQLYGLTIASERPMHHMRETWHPLGPVAVISAFNFPVAVWVWNAALAIVCGDSVIWKPSEKTPLCALACEKLWVKAIKAFKASGHDCPDYLIQILLGDGVIGKALCDDPKIALISATGSGRMGRAVAQNAATTLKRTLLELGGNNAMIVAPSADLEMAVRAIVFGAVGTAGQRCTTLRRLIVHKSIQAKLLASLVGAYASVKIGNPLNKGILNGPLIDQNAFDHMQSAIKTAIKEGGKVLYGGERVSIRGCNDGYYVRPCIIQMPHQSVIMRHETFAPILYVVSYERFEDAIALQNDVPQGLSSCIFTLNMREAEMFLSASGSDCGIANVNIGPSGAEIGGAFGGEKETGGGRESGSDSWKVYMRRQTQTVNYSNHLPLAQGIVFET